MTEEITTATPDEQLREKIHENAEIVIKGNLQQRIESLDILITELKQSTSSMTSVPKPMKWLMQYLDDMIRSYSNFSDEMYKVKLADILSLLSIVNIDKNYDILLYRLQSPISDIGCWGHEYVRCLTLAILKAYDHPESVPSEIDYSDLITQISKYYMEHNDEPDAVDLLLHVNRIDDIIDLVDEESYKRVCIYLQQCHYFLPDPVNTKVLEVLLEIYKKLDKKASQLSIALKMNNHDLIHDIFFSADPLLQKQLSLMLARQLIVFEDEMDQDLTEIATNAKLFSYFTKIAERLQKGEPKTPDDILHFQHTSQHRGNIRNENRNLQLIAKSIVNGFHNAALKKDLYFTPKRGEEAITRNSEMGIAVAVASIAFLHLWDIENGPNSIQKFIESKNPFLQMGALTGVGIVSAAVRSEFDPALAILREFLEEPTYNINVIVGAILGLTMAYAGSNRTEILELLSPLIAHSDSRISTYSVLGIGLTFVGSSNSEAISVLSAVLDKKPNKQFIPLNALGLGLIFLGQQSKVESLLEIIKTSIDDVPYKNFLINTVEALAYAGTGNVLIIQKLLRSCISEDSIEHAAAVLGIAIVALGEPVGAQMSKRMFDHLLQYGKPYSRRMVPIALALTSVSKPDPDIVDTLHRIAHDTDSDVAANAALALGILAAGTMNNRAQNVLKSLEQFHKSNTQMITLIQISEGLVQLGQGLMELSPIYGENILHPVILGSLLVIAFSSIDSLNMFLKVDPLLIFFVAPAISPRFLVTMDENLEILPIQVRVGNAIDVVGQAGRPRTITGFQTLDTPVILAQGQRAELVDESWEPLSPMLEGFVIVRKKPTKE